jgi:hypothetical protein
LRKTGYEHIILLTEGSWTPPLAFFDYHTASVGIFGVPLLHLTWASLAGSFFAFQGMLSSLTKVLS